MTALSIRGGLSAFTGQPLDLDLVHGRIAAAGLLGPPRPARPWSTPPACWCRLPWWSRIITSPPA